LGFDFQSPTLKIQSPTAKKKPNPKPNREAQAKAQAEAQAQNLPYPTNASAKKEAIVLLARDSTWQPL
jgi:hypothetical protein